MESLTVGRTRQESWRRREPRTEISREAPTVIHEASHADRIDE